MICRITLNLRTTVYGSATYDEQTTGSLQLTEMPRRRSRYRSGATGGRQFSTPFASSSITSSLRIGVHVQTRTETERASAYSQLNGSPGVQRPRVVRYSDAYSQDTCVGLESMGSPPTFSDRYSDSPSFASGSGWRLHDTPSFGGGRMLSAAGYGSIPESPLSPDVTTYAFASQGESSPRDETFAHMRSESNVSMYGPSDMIWKRKSDSTITMLAS